MITRADQGVPTASQLEVSLHWADGEPPVIARIEQGQARELIARFAVAAPDELEAAVAGVRSDPMMLLLGLQAFYRHVCEREGSLALVDAEGGLWTIPARNVRAIRLRLVPASDGARTSSEAVDPRTAFAPGALAGNGRC